MSEIQQILYSKQVVEFVAISNEWCTLVENAERFSKKDFVEKLHKLTAFLYQKASILPDTEQIFDTLEKSVTELDWTIINNNIEAKLVSNNDFVFVPELNTYQTDTENELSLSEITADIYQSIKDFLYLYKTDNEEIMNDALFEVKQDFGQYWGIRAIMLLKNLHIMIFNDNELIEEEFKPHHQQNNNENTERWIDKRMNS